MVVVLGITNSKDSGCALIKDGVLIAAANEERFNRQKLTQAFPFLSLAYVLSEANLDITDIDFVGVGMWSGNLQAWAFPQFMNECFDRSAASSSVLSVIKRRFNASIQSDAKKRDLLWEGLKSLGIPEEKVLVCDHHYAHALTASYFSPFDDSIVLTMDGRGDHQSSSLRLWNREFGFEYIHGTSELASLGAFYGWITSYLGFTPDRHEGKVTGLSALGDSSKTKLIFSKFIFYANGKINSILGDSYDAFMRSECPALRSTLSSFSREDIAAGAQAHLEETICEYLGFYADKLSLSNKGFNLALSGGIFANVRLNLTLKQLPFVKRIYVFPHMGDGGLSVGGAAYAALRSGDHIVPISDVFLGPAPLADDQFVEQLSDSHDLLCTSYDHPDDLANFAAECLQNGEIVGICHGRMEFGPRALGNRSIIANPQIPNITSILNERLNRSDFMPFAPVILKDYADLLLKDWSDDCCVSPYMTCCYECLPELMSLASSIVHSDNTVRPQVVDGSSNSIYSKILTSFNLLAQCPVLINTSFNLHETPIVNSLDEAFDVLLKGGIDHLVIADSYVVSRPSQ